MRSPALPQVRKLRPPNNATIVFQRPVSRVGDLTAVRLSRYTVWKHANAVRGVHPNVTTTPV